MCHLQEKKEQSSGVYLVIGVNEKARETWFFYSLKVWSILHTKWYAIQQNKWDGCRMFWSIKVFLHKWNYFCLRSCVIGCYIAEDYFIEKQGIFLLLDLLAVGIFIIDFVEWKSRKTTWKNALFLLQYLLRLLYYKKKTQKICAFNSLGQTQISAQKLLYRFSLYLFSFFLNTYLTEGVFNLTKLYYFWKENSNYALSLDDTSL